ncbi:MAG: hypothetical protein EOM10_12860 [Opitutae bacterium]|nr:hypothetical protein [Opitutae bacterium]
MRALRTFATGTAVWTAAWLAAAAPPETGFFAFGANTYSAGILDLSREPTEARCPELFQPPAVGDAFAYRVFRGKELRREMTATVVSPHLLECADGPEIAIHPGQLRLDLLRALYLTDALHQTPQILEGPPADPVSKPVFKPWNPPPFE